MPVARIDPFLTAEGGAVVNDEVQLLGGAEGEPGAREIERRARDRGQAEYFPVEAG